MRRRITFLRLIHRLDMRTAGIPAVLSLTTRVEWSRMIPEVLGLNGFWKKFVYWLTGGKHMIGRHGWMVGLDFLIDGDFKVFPVVIAKAGSGLFFVERTDDEDRGGRYFLLQDDFFETEEEALLETERLERVEEWREEAEGDGEFFFGDVPSGSTIDLGHGLVVRIERTDDVLMGGVVKATGSGWNRKVGSDIFFDKNGLIDEKRVTLASD